MKCTLLASSLFIVLSEEREREIEGRRRRGEEEEKEEKNETGPRNGEKLFNCRETGRVVNFAGSNSAEDTFYERAFPRGKTDAVYSSRYDTLHSRISMNRNGSQLPIIRFCAGRGAEIARRPGKFLVADVVCDLTDCRRLALAPISHRTDTR